MLIQILLSLAYAQEYQTHPDNYAFPTREAASDACGELGLELCSSEQLYSVVFGSGDYAVPNLCKSGWTSSETGDYQIGWWNNDITSCAKKTGWNSWLPATGDYGAHCCSTDVPETVPVTCASIDSCSGEQIFVDGFASEWCTDGICTEEQCCRNWEPAPLWDHVPSRWGYEYFNGDDADAACQEANEDWSLCTYEQLEGLALNEGITSCSSAWFKCHESLPGCEDGYRRGFYVTEEDAAAGNCGSNSGFREWAPLDGSGAAHCCAPSFVKSEYGDIENSLEAAAEWCDLQPYTKNVCLSAQLETVAKSEDTNICRSGYFLENEDDTEGQRGWYQGVAEIDGRTVCGGNTGWRYWASETPAAHCCADYVIIPDLGEFTFTPEYYGQGYATGAAAANQCTTLGYDDLCTLGQLIHVGTEIETDLCIVGWVRDGDGYDAGYYRTDDPGCGQHATWNNGWQPATPVAFCCMDSVPEVELTYPAYYNGDWDYSYTTMEEAAAQCTGEYSLCSEDQVYTVAVHGITYPDDAEFQIEPTICRLGWTSDNTKMWWQGEEASCGAAGYRTYTSTLAGYHCCKDFPTVSPDPTTTTFGTYEAFTKAHPSYKFFSEDEASEACTALHPEFQLCSSNQIVEVALNGAEDDGTFLSVAAQTEICFTSWVDTSRAVCDEPKDIGFYRVIPGCGASQGFQWSSYRPVLEDGTQKAGAWCCAPSIVPRQDYLVELDCAPETTLLPTVAPQETLYFPLSDSVCLGLGIGDCSTIYTRDNQFYISEDNANFAPTCVAYSSVDEAVCDYTTLVCAGVLRRIYGSLAEQGILLTQAMSEDNNMHTSCPPESCSAYDEYSPEDFAEVVDYCRGDDGCYYMNGMETCICDSQSSDVAADLQSLWESSFELSQCTDVRTFDEIMNDQLFITNQMITDLEEQVDSIPDVNTQLESAQEELDTIWTDWETEITATINAAIATAENDGDQELVDSLNGIIEALSELSAE